MILYPTTDNQVHCSGGTCVLLPHHITDNLTFKYHEEEHAFPYFPFFLPACCSKVSLHMHILNGIFCKKLPVVKNN